MNNQINDNQKFQADQRYIPRWHVQNRVVFQGQNEQDSYEGQTKDLSCTGACISINQSVLPAKEIKLTIFLTPDTTVQLNGQIVWVKDGENEKKIGIHFLDVEANEAEKLLDHAFEISPDTLRNHWFKGWNGDSN